MKDAEKKFRQVKFTSHAMVKLQVLRKHGVMVDENEVVDVVRHPDKVIKSKKGRFVAQKVYDEKHLIRVIYEVKDENALVVTFYPAKRERYES